MKKDAMSPHRDPVLFGRATKCSLPAGRETGRAALMMRAARPFYSGEA